MRKKIFFTAVLAVSYLFSIIPCSGSVTTEAYKAYIRGLLAAQSGNTKLAITEYERAIIFDKNAVPIYRELALIYWQIGKTKEAFVAGERLDKYCGKDLETQLFLGNFYLLIGETQKAKIAWENALKIDPNDETAILHLAAYHSNDNKHEKAVTYWNRFVKQEPNSAEAYYQLGISQEKLGKIIEAKESFQKTISLDPNSSDSHLFLARIYEKEEKYLAAAQEYEMYLQIVPDNLSVISYLGGMYYKIKNYSAAKDTYLKALSIAPEDLNVNFWLGIIAEIDKDWDQAIKYFEFIRNKDQTPAVLTRLSYYYSLKKDYKHAVQYLKEVVRIEPNNSSSYYLLGLAYFDQKKYGNARKNFQHALKIDPEMDEAYYHLGVLYDQRGKFKKAIPMMERAIAIDPNNAQALNYLGYSYADRDMKFEEAESFIKRALKVNPESGSYIDSLGWVYFKQGKYPESEMELERAVKLFSDPIIWEHLGDAKYKLDKISEAWDAYQKSSALDPKNKEVIKKIRMIEKSILPDALQRKVLKKALDNLLQITSFRASFTVAGQAKDINFRFAGIFRYQRPKLFRVDVLGNIMAPQMVIIQNQEIKVSPSAFEGLLSTGEFSFLNEIKDYFNSEPVESFDPEKVKTTEKEKYFIYKIGEKSLVVDRRNGTIKEYKVKDSLIFRFGKYDSWDGLYIPGEIEVFSKVGLTGKVKLTNFVLNQKIEENVFDIK